MPRVKAEHKKIRKSQILNAAFKCFSKKGYQGTSMRDIFKEANLSAGAVYNYYDSKEAIVRELVVLGQTSTKELLESILTSGKKDLIKNLLDDYFDLIDTPAGTNGIRTDISIWATALNDKKLLKLVQNSFSQTSDQFTAAFKSNSSDLEAEGLAFVLISIIQGATIQKILNPKFDLDLYKKTIIKLLEAV